MGVLCHILGVGFRGSRSTDAATVLVSLFAAGWWARALVGFLKGETANI